MTKRGFIRKVHTSFHPTSTWRDSCNAKIFSLKNSVSLPLEVAPELGELLVEELHDVEAVVDEDGVGEVVLSRGWANRKDPRMDRRQQVEHLVASYRLFVEETLLDTPPHPVGEISLEAAVQHAFESGSPRYAVIQTLLRVGAEEPRVVEPVPVS
jgi:hypothetical protein